MPRLQSFDDSPHTKIHLQKEIGFCKGAFQEEVNEEVEEEVKKETAKQPPKQKPTKTIPTITDYIVNAYIKENPGIVTNYLRNERVMKAQREQMNARSLLNKAS